jgi:hypothetical protein
MGKPSHKQENSKGLIRYVTKITLANSAFYKRTFTITMQQFVFDTLRTVHKAREPH